MLSAVFLPFALVHFVTFAILIYKSSACQIFDFRVFPEKPTRCQLFTFLGHISLLKNNAATYLYKPDDAVLHRSIFCYSPYISHSLYHINQAGQYKISNIQFHQIIMFSPQSDTEFHHRLGCCINIIGVRTI